MYVALYIAFLALGSWLLYGGIQRGRFVRAALGAVVIASTVGFFTLLDFVGELWWFESLGYAGRFWRTIAAQSVTTFAGAVIALAAIVALLAAGGERRPSVVRWAAVAGGLGGALLGFDSWEQALLFVNRVPTDVSEPILGLSTGFYLFVLPLLDRLAWLATWIAVVVLAATIMPILRAPRGGATLVVLDDAIDPRLLRLASAMFAVVLTLHFGLAVFQLLLSSRGVVFGAGWTDQHVRLPAYFVLAALTLVVGFAPLVPALGSRLAPRRVRGRAEGPVLAAWGVIVGAWIVGLGLVPAAFQWLVVEPNEITFERPYIANNIQFTRRGFHLENVDEREFPAKEQLTRQTLKDNADLLSEVRLWDWRALDAVYKQFQEIRLYYEFHDVDIDRYQIGNDYRQVMVSAREMESRNLPAQSQTFVNRRFIYTHGYGLTLAPVSDFTPDGLPNMLVKDIPPKSNAPDLQVERPQIYYGERTVDPAVVNTRQAEFDYPSGEDNVYTRYTGTGGVQLSSLWRKFVYGWMFDGTRLLFSSYPTHESRIMFHREVHERVRQVAPFLHFDQDAYIVLADGRLYWIVDGYTTSSDYPYSTPLTAHPRVPRGSRDNVGSLYGANYVRNSVKAVVDAFEGTVRLYVFAPDDPLIRAWSRAFPDTFRPRARMPQSLQAHVRYPVGYLLAQGLVYAKYHMSDPEVFYNQEDLWVRATEKHYSSIEPVDPYYVMWQRPGSGKAEFALMMPFTPRNRQVLIGWIAGLCDGDDYGRFIAYQFPKERRIIGPQQVETKIDQDPFLAGQLTLWDQRGSSVIRGNVLAIPIGQTLLYVEPIYLEASTAAYPEMRLVVVMHGDKLSYAKTFDAALAGLFKNGEAAPAQAEQTGSAKEQPLARQARDAFEDYLRLQSEQRFEEAAKALSRLRDSLEKLAPQ